MMTKHQYDRTWGIDRNRGSRDYNKLILGGENTMPIVLWNTPGARPVAENVSGGLKHDERVKILAKTIIDGNKYVKVSRTVIHEGKKWPQTGWLSATLLKREGAL